MRAISLSNVSIYADKLTLKYQLGEKKPILTFFIFVVCVANAVDVMSLKISDTILKCTQADIDKDKDIFNDKCFCIAACKHLHTHALTHTFMHEN